MGRIYKTHTHTVCVEALEGRAAEARSGQPCCERQQGTGHTQTPGLWLQQDTVHPPHCAKGPRGWLVHGQSGPGPWLLSWYRDGGTGQPHPHPAAQAPAQALKPPPAAAATGRDLMGHVQRQGLLGTGLAGGHSRSLSWCALGITFSASPGSTARSRVLVEGRRKGEGRGGREEKEEGNPPQHVSGMLQNSRAAAGHQPGPGADVGIRTSSCRSFCPGGFF